MLRTSLRDKPPVRTDETPELVDGATELIEAATAEAAIAQVHERLGPDARILEAQRDLRGGIGGFFAKEVVRLHAAPGPSREGSVAVDVEGADADEAVSARSPVERLLDDAPDTVDFATFLRERMETDPALRADVGDDVEVVTEDRPPVVIDPGPSIAEDEAVAAWRAAARRPVAPPIEPDPVVRNLPIATPWSEAHAPRPTVADPVAAPESVPSSAVSIAPAAVPGPMWSSERLLHLGVPADLVRSLAVASDADDLTWTVALAGELEGACGPLPSGPALLVGPLADDLKGQVDGPTARSQVWFDALRDGRWLHLVVGGEGWRDQLSAGPRVVSWTRPQDLPDALRCARELGLTLGYGPLGGEIRRARPLDVAIAIRALVDGR